MSSLYIIFISFSGFLKFSNLFEINKANFLLKTKLNIKTKHNWKVWKAAVNQISMKMVNFKIKISKHEPLCKDACLHTCHSVSNQRVSDLMLTQEDEGMHGDSRTELQRLDLTICYWNTLTGFWMTHYCLQAYILLIF